MNLGAIKLDGHLALELYGWQHYIHVLILLDLWLIDEQEGHDWVLPNQVKADTRASLSTRDHKLNIIGPNVLITGR